VRSIGHGSRVLGVVCAVSAGFHFACASYPVPLSAQKGSTIAIPIAAGEDQVVGYGGAMHTDHQRGSMVYRLDSASGPELTTRFTVASAPHAAAPLSTTSTNLSTPPQIVSIVDIPNSESVTEGPHTLRVFRRPTSGTDVELVFNPQLQIKILPQSVPTAGGNVVGSSTPSVKANCTPIWGCNFSSMVGDAIPAPRIDFYVQASDYNQNISAFEFDLDYPEDVIDIVDAYQVGDIMRVPNDTGTVWVDDDGEGHARVTAVAHPDAFASPSNYWRLQVVFSLDNGASAILDPAELTPPPSVTAYDLEGNVIAATVTMNGIR
jgi:hypothetical protein